MLAPVHGKRLRNLLQRNGALTLRGIVVLGRRGVVALALVAAGCGGDDDSTGTGTGKIDWTFGLADQYVDFLAKGGSGYGAFARATPEKDLGILRDVLAAQLSASKGATRFTARLDGRWKNLAPPAAPPAEASASSDE